MRSPRIRGMQSVLYAVPTVMPTTPPRGGAGDSGAAPTEPVFEWRIEHWTTWQSRNYQHGYGYRDITNASDPSTMTVYASTEAGAFAKVDAAFTLPEGHTREHRVVSVNEVRP